MRAGVLVIAAVASTAIGFAQAPGGGPAGRGLAPQAPAQTITVPARGSASVRVPAWRKLRTAVGSLLGWPAGVSLGGFRPDTFVDAVRKSEALDLAVVEGDATQQVSTQIPKALDYRLAPGEIDFVNQRLNELNVRMPVYVTSEISEDEAIARRQFEFAKRVSVETIAVERMPKTLPVVEKLADEFGVNVALTGHPRTLANGLEGRSRRIGVYADAGKWIQEGVSVTDALAQFKDRVFAVRLGDRNGIVKLAPAITAMYKQGVKPSLITVTATGAPAGVELNRSLEAFEKTVHSIVVERVAEMSRGIPIKGADRLTPEERETVTAATPKKPAAAPKSTRRLLVYDANIGYGGANGGHRSIPAANMAIELFAKATGAFEPVFSNDLDNFRYERLKTFDAVFLNNTVGQIFVDPEVRAGLGRFVREGGGLAGYHGTSHASMDWPEFAEILGAVEGSHREPTEIATVRIDDPGSPLMRAFGSRAFVHQDEFYRFVEPPLSRDRVRVLMSIDVEKTDLNQGRGCARPCVRPDADYALSWIHNYGKGRVFFTALGHTPAFFASPDLSDFFFRGIQFALGDLEADATPGGKASRR